MFPNYLSGNNAGQNIIYRNFPQNCPKYEVGSRRVAVSDFIIA